MQEHQGQHHVKKTMKSIRHKMKLVHTHAAQLKFKLKNKLMMIFSLTLKVAP